jgi:aminoglycoside phosphotransferase (APT) family kinase protein
MNKQQIKALSDYFSNYLAQLGKIKDIIPFDGGQSNPTYKVITQLGCYVLRKQPDGELLKAAHAVDREYKVLVALQNSKVPVAQPIHFCDDRSVIGTLFYVMEFADGRIFWDPALPELDNHSRNEIYLEMARILAALHEINPKHIGLGDYGKPGNYFERQLSRWKRNYFASIEQPDPNMTDLITWLEQNMPEEDGLVSLIHGDFRLDNLIFSHHHLQAIALLDWELSTLGHPFADLGYQCMQLRMSREGALKGLGDINRVDLGIPSEQQYIALYCQYRGIESIPNWTFYLCFSFFRFAAILQGVFQRAQQGNAASSKALEYGKMAPELAKIAVDLINHNEQ